MIGSMRHLLPLALGLSACAPRLYSEVTDDTGGLWTPPQNSWPVCGETSASTRSEGFSAGQVIPALEGQDQHGEPVALWQFAGCLTVVDISTMWCAPCQELAEGVEHTAQEFLDDGVIYVTVLPQDVHGEVPDLGELQQWADAFGITSPVMSDPVEWYRDAVPDSTFPRVLLVGEDLRVLEPDIPATDGDIRAAIQKHL